MSRPRYGYMCETDYLHEIGEAPGGVEVYCSVEDVKRHKKCWESCGIVKVKIVKVEPTKKKAKEPNEG